MVSARRAREPLGHRAVGAASGPAMDATFGGTGQSRPVRRASANLPTRSRWLAGDAS